VIKLRAKGNVHMVAILLFDMIKTYCSTIVAYLYEDLLQSTFTIYTAHCQTHVRATIATTYICPGDNNNVSQNGGKSSFLYAA
jgi:hypothetical protein